MRSSLLAGLLLVFGLAFHPPLDARAQAGPRYGLGVQLMGSTVDNNIGPGFRFRVSAPLTRDVSLGFGSSFTGYILEGRDEASYAVDPQASLIVTLPGSGQESLYVMTGAGAYLPFGATNATSGPTFHLGLGKVWLLRQSSFFFELDPALYVGEDATSVIIPVRVGVIF